ncbi:tetraspanin-17-like [Saccoglossus kowalevskii]|uniref:Tetraspanin-17-like n=1 Tax=Saccoglossus kowalevskii TaxID=10224 RepID=A0ABM0GXB0_SACKO|nr:PREDICTED: tetraspanin-17-like [Saccoglossus kowalevskii]
MNQAAMHQNGPSAPPYDTVYDSGHVYRISGGHVENTSPAQNVMAEPRGAARPQRQVRRQTRRRVPRMESTRKRHQRQQSGQVSLCVKYGIFFYNLVFWIVGTALLAFGTWGLVTKGTSVDEIIGGFIDPMWFIVIIGAFIFIISMAGCIGALRENTCLLKFFAIILSIIMLAETAVVVLAFVYKEQGNIIGGWIDRAIVDYRDDPDTQFLLDQMQIDLKCCGSTHPNDWDNNPYFNCSSPAVSACGVPYSCCIKPEGELVNYQCGYGRLREKPDHEWIGVIHVQGCAVSIEQWMNQNLVIICAAIGGILLVQAVSICFVKSLIHDIREIKSHWRVV